jgi:uncharacterized membrane protein
MPWSELLRRTPLFGNLSVDDLAELGGHLVPKRFAAGQEIFRQGEAGTEMFVVAEGQVNVFLPGEGSRRVSLQDLGPGEHLGELGLFEDKPRSASALATTDAVLLALSRQTLTSFFEHRPHAVMPILKTMAKRLRKTNSLLSQRAARNVAAEFEKSLGWKDRLADRVAQLNGSWAFIVGLLMLIAGWMALNAGLLGPRFDPYPYVFFNLVLAILVVLQGPLIVMSQNRQVLKERAQAEADYNVNLKNEVNIETILRELGEFRGEVGSRLKPLGERPVGHH